MPSTRSRSRSRSPSPFTKRAQLSRFRDSHSPRRRSPRSSSPRPHHHERSRSPRRRHDDRPKKSSGGFKWKEKPRQQDDEDRRDDRRLERGYRDQERPRQRSPARENAGRRDDIEAKFGRQRSPLRQQDRKNNGVEEKFGGEPPRKEKKKRDKPTIAPTSQEMIIVNVNDRLGTKAAIPCLASDPIKLFKAQVAARIGRQPHEIMLKRQGERPFKDQLTLEDYGVSNGVQLDLEIDTGD